MSRGTRPTSLPVDGLPIDGLLEAIAAALRPAGSTLVLQAPPGAGKTSRVPLALLGCLEGRIWMLEPRRLAAKAAAERLASALGEAVGGQAGYSVRLESRASATTRIEVLTAGLFLRRLQADPSLEGVDCLLFDEFHERSAEADLALALVRQARQLLRPDLRLGLMSATLAAAELAEQLPGAQLLRSEGRQFPVTIAHQPPRSQERLEQQLIRALEGHWLDHHGPGETALVFLPGQREIRACLQAVMAAPWQQQLECIPLHGDLPLAAQSRAIAPARGDGAKLVLATSIAESSLTIEGVTLVIDSGLSRRSRFDPGTGMDGLVTVLASQASAEQRAGRAGRLGPGRCLRLWSQAEQQRRPAFDPPAIRERDPLPMALQLAQWGDPLGQGLDWLEAPPPQALAEARRLLEQLGALDAEGRLSAHGQRLSELGLHPRLGHLLLAAAERDQLPLGSALAVLLSERDPLDRREAGCDLLRRLDWLLLQGRDPRRQRLRQQQRQLQRQLQRPLERPLERQLPEPAGAGGPRPTASNGNGQDGHAALLVALAFPERVALARPGGQGRFLTRQGRGAVLPPGDPLAGCEALAIARADGAGKDAQIQLAVPLGRSGLRELAAEQGGRWRRLVRWDGASGQVRRELQYCLDALVLEQRPWGSADQEPRPQLAGLELDAELDGEADRLAVRTALLEGLASAGLQTLPWTHAARQLQQRLQLAHAHLGAPWPDRRDTVLAADLESWLGPQLDGCTSLAELQQLDLVPLLWGDAPWALRQELEQLLPMGLPVPSGRLVALDYGDGTPVLAVKLQELFGLRQTPRLLGGRIAVTLHLLTPAGRPAAITQDLASFWESGYREVRRELRGRYPKHPWPDDPWAAQPTALTNARLQRSQPGPARPGR